MAPKGMGMPMFGMAMGGSAKFKIAEDLVEAVRNASAQQFRAVQIEIKAKEEQCDLGGVVKEHDTIKDDWDEIVELCEDGVPCVILLRLKPVDGDSDVPSADEDEFCMISWTPEDTPPKQRMVASACQKNIKDALPFVSWGKSYPIMDRAEATYAAWKEATAAMSDADRRAAMTEKEKTAQDTHAAMERERASLGQKQIGLAGLGNLVCTTHESFNAGVAVVMSGVGKVLVGKTAGSGGRKEVLGEILAEDIASPAGLQGKLPAEEPCFVFMKYEENPVLISWLPEVAPVMARMAISTSKSSVVECIKGLTSQAVITNEASVDDWLTDDLGKKVDTSDEPPPVVHGGTKVPGMPVGGFKLPGMS